MRIVITGADGFIGKNLRVRLRECGYLDIVSLTRETSARDLRTELQSADVVFHLAGVNRPKDESEFTTGNIDLTATICDALADAKRPVHIAYTSSTQAAADNPYGRSKRGAEERLEAFAKNTGASVSIFRLTNVFGKWARPNYNSAVATFCHNVTRGLPITVNDRGAKLRLVYIDDVVDAFLALLEKPVGGFRFVEANPVYETNVGEVADLIEGFAASRTSLVTSRVGTGLTRALYSTYVSYLPPEAFVYSVPRHGDPRGTFAEVMKTPDCGQFSYFTAHPGITRGEHYHHTKTEKFVVIRGKAKFGFRHIETNEVLEIFVEGGSGEIVETVPGWAHDITNVGDDEMIVMLWANEIFDRVRPDTISMKVFA